MKIGPEGLGIDFSGGLGDDLSDTGEGVGIEGANGCIVDPTEATNEVERDMLSDQKPAPPERHEFGREPDPLNGREGFGDLTKAGHDKRIAGLEQARQQPRHPEPPRSAQPTGVESAPFDPTEEPWYKKPMHSKSKPENVTVFDEGVEL